ncbi:MAG: glycosyltransferase [Pseudomonadota bacterium]|nr:glycosyltransferase [Pseudomonadota bacterium]MDP1903390.1 glycosyltransferase [Pseudomonadota bacterium]MDP2352360.1 glycosyltransferase [Pseudomonadota bacterium]
MTSIVTKVRHLLYRLPVPPQQPGRLNVLLITNSKKNQGWYRDNELIRLTNGVRIAEDFPWDRYGWDVRRAIEAIYGSGGPDVVYLHYNRAFSHRILGMDKLEMPKVGFVGDPQDFITAGEKYETKLNWMREAGFDAYMTIAPQANWMVRQGLQDAAMPIINSHLAVDIDVFHDMKRRRDHDIGSFGAHTDAKYPFRIQVRDFLLAQDDYSFNRKQRVGRGGNDASRFARELNRYVSCFTCASAFGYTVAKYYEVPACGTLLFGEHTCFLDEFGYRDGVNFVEVAPGDFKDKFHYYLREISPEERRRIAEAGRELVLSRHTWKHRAAGIVAGFEEVVAGNTNRVEINP